MENLECPEIAARPVILRTYRSYTIRIFVHVYIILILYFEVWYVCICRPGTYAGALGQLQETCSALAVSVCDVCSSTQQVTADTARAIVVCVLRVRIIICMY